MSTKNETTMAVDHYLEAWSTDDDKVRARSLDLAWADECSYADPIGNARGRESIGQMMKGLQEKYPGVTFGRTSGVDEHHGQIRFNWAMKATDGSVMVTGVDYGEVAGGRLTRIVGFFGEPPASEA